MSRDTGDSSSAGPARWAIPAALLLLLVALAASAWWWMQARDRAAVQAAELQVLMQRQQELVAQLTAIRPLAPPVCAPGEILRPVGAAAPPARAASP